MYALDENTTIYVGEAGLVLDPSPEMDIDQEPMV